MMDPVTVSIATAIAAWLWPLWKSAAEGFGGEVGKGLGTSLVTVLRQARQSLGVPKVPEEHDMRQLDPQLVQSIAELGKPALKRLLRNPDFFVVADLVAIFGDLGYTMEQFGIKQVTVAHKLVDQAWARSKFQQLQEVIENHLGQELADRDKVGIKRLLRNPNRCTSDDLLKIVADMDYTLGQFTPLAATQVSVAQEFVDKAWADGKAVDLVRTIQEQKPHLFSDG